MHACMADMHMYAYTVCVATCGYSYSLCIWLYTCAEVLDRSHVDNVPLPLF